MAEVQGVHINGLGFSYPGQTGPPGEAFIQGCNLEIPRGSRCLLVGANGAGKTTLLHVGDACFVWCKATAQARKKMRLDSGYAVAPHAMQH